MNYVNMSPTLELLGIFQFKFLKPLGIFLSRTPNSSLRKSLCHLSYMFQALLPIRLGSCSYRTLPIKRSGLVLCRPVSSRSHQTGRNRSSAPLTGRAGWPGLVGRPAHRLRNPLPNPWGIGIPWERHEGAALVQRSCPERHCKKEC